MIYPGPEPDDPAMWTLTHLFGDVRKPVLKPRCALCGRPVVRSTSCVFFNLAHPLGRQYVVMWHDGCGEREPEKPGMWWPRRRSGAWGRLLLTVAQRGPGRIGPGLAREEREALEAGRMPESWLAAPDA